MVYMKATTFNENVESATTAMKTTTSDSNENTALFSTEDWNTGLGEINTTESVSKVNNVSLSLAITCGISLLLSAIVISLLIAVAFRNYRLQGQRSNFPAPPETDYQPEF